MPKDYANIYNLPEHEREAEKKDLWGNCVPGSEERAKQLLQKISVSETPYVLSLEAEYGMGKTYFATRFCEYLKNNGIDALYISAWEQDYQPSPFCFIMSEIICYLQQRTEPVTKSSLSNLIKEGSEIVKKLLFSTHLSAGTKMCNMDVDIEKFCKTLIKPKDDIKDFKQELQNILRRNHINPLVIIIDELDRCRPDYALKTLEIIKHFFDVDNLFVILPVNKLALRHAVISTYGNLGRNEENNIENNEHYLCKLITEDYYLEKPTSEQYEKIVTAYINKENLSEEIKNQAIVVSPKGHFNSFNMISKYIAEYSSKGFLTYRETVNVCRQLVEIAHKIRGKLYIEYLAYLLCDKYKHSKLLELNGNHPFQYAFNKENHPKYNVLYIDNLYNQTQNLNNYIRYSHFYRIYEDKLKRLDRNSHFSSYKEFYEFISGALADKSEIINTPTSQQYKEQLEKIYDAITQAHDKAKKYQNRYGSTDEDEKVKAYYDNIAKDPLVLYTEK